MQLKDGFILRTVAGETVVVPTGEDLDLDMIITLNETGRFLWGYLETDVTEDQLAAALLAEYDVDEKTAREHVALFVEKLSKNGFLK